MQTLVTGLVLTVMAVVALVVSVWQDAKARGAGQQAADESLHALQRRREGADDDRGGAEEGGLLKAQRRYASVSYALKRAAIILLAVGLLGVVGGSLALLL